MAGSTHSPLAEALAELVPAGCAGGLLAIDAVHERGLAPGERDLVPTARATRLAEFATGRALLHHLLSDAGPLLRLPNGAVAFPAGTVGSLAHDRAYAAAVVGPADPYAALGIDIEQHVDADDELVRAVLRDDDPAIEPIAAFVMKEAAYKAWSSLGIPMLGPLDVRLEVSGVGGLDGTAGRFTAHTVGAAPVSGMVAHSGSHWLAVASIE